jgi:hypothetical protein
MDGCKNSRKRSKNHKNMVNGKIFPFSGFLGITPIL